MGILDYFLDYWFIFLFLWFVGYVFLTYMDPDTEPQQDPPELGRYIEITWLPNPRNHPNTPSCYIGSKGKVDKVYADGGFDLNMGSGILIVGDNEYIYEYITEENFNESNK